MVHFQNRNHILSWLEKNCSRKAIVRILNSEGEIEFLGGFNPIPPTSHPGWMVQMTSIYGKLWYVAVIAYQNRYGIRILKEVPWENWAGNGADAPGLINGDHPYLNYCACKRITDINKEDIETGRI